MRHIILISGKDSLAAALVQTTRHPGLPYEFIFNDVEAELPETYVWLDCVEAKTGWPITRVGESLPARIRLYGGFLPGKKSRYCTRDCKIEPLEAMIGGDACTVYYGLRADEARTGYVPVGKPNVTPAYPLREAGVDMRGVYSILDAQNLAPPDFFWQRLYDVVAARMAAASGWGGEPWEAKLSRLERQTMFAGRSRANCFFCFFQRRSEFVWLYETHPDLYAVAESLEKPGYAFMKGLPLRKLRRPEVLHRLFEKRVNEACRTIGEKFQRNLFPLEMDNELALTSCGLLCGK